MKKNESCIVTGQSLNVIKKKNLRIYKYGILYATKEFKNSEFQQIYYHKKNKEEPWMDQPV